MHIHSAKASHEHLPHGLKGIDMIVYQTLKRFTNEVKVQAMLDDTQYRKRRAEIAEEMDEEDAEQQDTGNAYLSEDRTVQSLPDQGEEEAGGPPPEEVGYAHKEVTWINHSPDETSHQELAAAFITVSTATNEKGLSDGPSVLIL
jgi:hypothetical protein